VRLAKIPHPYWQGASRCQTGADKNLRDAAGVIDQRGFNPRRTGRGVFADRFNLAQHFADLIASALTVLTAQQGDGQFSAQIGIVGIAAHHVPCTGKALQEHRKLRVQRVGDIRQMGIIC